MGTPRSMQRKGENGTETMLMGTKERRNLELVRLGQRVTRLRQALGLDQAQLAERLYSDASEVSRIENGHRDVKFSNLLRLAKVLDVSVTELAGEDQETLRRLAREMLTDSELSVEFVRLGGAHRRAGPRDRTAIRRALMGLADAFAGAPPEMPETGESADVAQPDETKEPARE